jgi:hypothetical protein
VDVKSHGNDDSPGALVLWIKPTLKRLQPFVGSIDVSLRGRLGQDVLDYSIALFSKLADVVGFRLRGCSKFEDGRGGRVRGSLSGNGHSGA